MKTPTVTLKLRRFRRRFGITAPKVVVKSHLPWQWFAVPVILLVLLVGVVSSLIAQRNEAGELEHEVGELREQLRAQREELNVLRSAVGTGQNAVSIERASQQQLVSKINGLEAQNARLKEDILLFERLIPVAGDVASLRVENFRVSAERRGMFRYRLLLAFQPDKQNAEFRGRLQLTINYTFSGKEFKVLLPDKKEVSADYHLEIKHFLRREGVFELPEGAMLQSAEAAILQGDTLKAKRLAEL
ncbi:MAG: hypothetical protein H6R14_915 [Proteobacteria bacterium]|nr:hypothetical protein [Pseudomonadota bacterium]